MPTHSRCHAHPAFSLIWRFTHTPAHSEPGQCLPPAQPQLGRDVQTSPHFSRVGPDDGDRRPVVSSDGPWLVVAVSGLWVGAPSVLRVGAPSVFGSRSLVLFLGFVPLLCSWVSFPRFAVGLRSLALLGCVPFLCWVAFPCAQTAVCRSTSTPYSRRLGLLELRGSHLDAAGLLPARPCASSAPPSSPCRASFRPCSDRTVRNAEAWSRCPRP